MLRKLIHFILLLYILEQVTFKLQPMFKRSLTYVMGEDTDLGDEAVIFGEKHEFADFLWLPSQGKVVYRIDDRVPVNVSGNGLFNYLPFRSQSFVILAGNRYLGSFFISKILFNYTSYKYIIKVII